MPPTLIMQRTVPVPATQRALTDNDFQQAKTAVWPVPSQSFDLLAERLLVFFVAQDPRKAHTRYVGGLLRRTFGAEHCGRTPCAFEEQELQESLRLRYGLDRPGGCATPCVRCCAPPGFGGAYDKNAHGWTMWWMMACSVPMLLLLGSGIALAIWAQQYSLVAYDAVPLAMEADNKSATSNSSDVSTYLLNPSQTATTFAADIAGIPPALFRSQARNANSTIFCWDIGVDTAIGMSLRGIERAEESLEYDPLVRSPGLELADDDGGGLTLRVAWQLVDAAGFVVSELPVLSLRHDEIGTVMPVAGTVRLEKHTTTLKGAELPVRLLVTTAEFCSKSNLTGAAEKELLSVEITLEAHFRREVLSSFLIVVGSAFLLVGWVLVLTLLCVCCCVDRPGRVNGKCASEDHGKRRGSGARRRASRDDDVCLQIYWLWCCLDTVPNMCFCTTQVCDACCASLGELCGSLSRCVSDACGCGGGAAAEGGQAAAGYLCICGECGAACADLCAVCGECCDDCRTCNCDCGAMDCDLAC